MVSQIAMVFFSKFFETLEGDIPTRGHHSTLQEQLDVTTHYFFDKGHTDPGHGIGYVLSFIHNKEVAHLAVPIFILLSGKYFLTRFFFYILR